MDNGHGIWWLCIAAAALGILTAVLITEARGSWHDDYVHDHCVRCPTCCVSDDDHDERHLLEKAIECGLDPYLALRLLEVESLANIPTRLRGMTLGKACIESKGNPEAVGDGGRAVGIFQLWPWALAFINDRTDPIASAHVLLGRLVTTVRTVHRRCPQVRDRWVTAWIRINRGPFWRREDRRGEVRCSGTAPAGLKRLRYWRSQVRRLAVR